MKKKKIIFSESQRGAIKWSGISLRRLLRCFDLWLTLLSEERSTPSPKLMFPTLIEWGIEASHAWMWNRLKWFSTLRDLINKLERDSGTLLWNNDTSMASKRWNPKLKIYDPWNEDVGLRAHCLKIIIAIANCVFLTLYNIVFQSYVVRNPCFCMRL